MVRSPRAADDMPVTPVARIKKNPALVWWPAALWGAWFAANLLYGFVRSLGAHSFEPHDFEGLEGHVFGVVPTRWLQAEVYSRGVPWLDLTGFLLHGVWFGLPFAFGFVVMRYHRDRLAEFITWTIVVIYIGAFCFVALPVRPPWMEEGIVRVLAVRSPADYTVVDNNPYAAFPSLHAGLSMTIALFLLLRCERVRFFGWIALALSIGISASVVYMGEHWLLDVLAGWGVAALTAWICMSRKMRSLYARIPGDPVGRIARKNAAIYSRRAEPLPLSLPAGAESEAA